MEQRIMEPVPPHIAVAREEGRMSGFARHVDRTVQMLADLAVKHGDAAVFAERMAEIGRERLAEGHWSQDEADRYAQAVTVDFPTSFYAHQMRQSPRAAAAGLTAALAGGERERTLADLLPRAAVVALAEQAAGRVNATARR